jgi:SAM-dependent methyltransferase
MSDYGPETYGERWAEIYDEFAVGMASDPELAANLLAELAGGGPALELAIGTGRVALPLASRGVAVHGIDASEAMVRRLREKPGGADIPVTVGDFADVPVDESYPLIYVVFNTFFALLTQDDQVRCFENVASHLNDGGVFVAEAFVPELSRFDQGQRTETRSAEPDRLVLTGSTHDRAKQRIDVTQADITAQGVKLYPVQMRYAYPPELDLMAKLAGLRLRERWGGWDRAPFGKDSRSHVSVYERG